MRIVLRRCGLVRIRCVCDFHVGFDGSKPKGVAVSHAADGQSDGCGCSVEAIGLDQDDAMCMLQKTASTFDVSLWEFWSCRWRSGSRLVVATHEGRRSAGSAVSGVDVMAVSGVSTLTDCRADDVGGGVRGHWWWCSSGVLVSLQ